VVKSYILTPEYFKSSVLIGLLLGVYITLSLSVNSFESSR
jgi:hypothetical protein